MIRFILLCLAVVCVAHHTHDHGDHSHDHNDRDYDHNDHGHNHSDHGHDHENHGHDHSNHNHGDYGRNHGHHGHNHSRHDWSGDRGHDHGHGQQSHGHRGGIDNRPPVVRSPSGEFRGGFNVTRKGRRFETYRGIRYAEPPVGELRFQPPKLITEYPEPVEAGEDGPACPLPAPPGYPVDEDCLTVNVYTPLAADRKKPLPVIFFIHPGGFYSMTGRSDLAGPHYLLDRDLVLVTINYRLGALGFLSTGDAAAPGNNGFKDMVAALRWVRRNVAAFGGDPARVTVAGCSAGSISAMLLMLSPMAEGLFHRAISMSGSPISQQPLPEHQRHLAVRQAELLGCPTGSSRAILDCLKTKPWRELGDSLPGFYEFGFDPVLIWNAVVEPDFGQERFLTEQPDAAIRAGERGGNFHPVPHLISQTQDEFFWMAYNVVRNESLRARMDADWDSVAPVSFLLPRGAGPAAGAEPAAGAGPRRLRQAYLGGRPLGDDAASARDLGRLYADSIEGLPVYRMAKLMSLHSPQPVYQYEFGYVGNRSHYEDPATGRPEGAAHHDDLIYLFTLSYRFPALGTAGADSRLVDRMTAIWYNFAAYGDPNPRGAAPETEWPTGLRWPPLAPPERTYLRIDSELSLRSDLFGERAALWDELYPMQY